MSGFTSARIGAASPRSNGFWIRRRSIWNALKGIKRNGAPIMYITARALHGKALTRHDKSPQEFLGSVVGTGYILFHIKEAWANRVGQYLVKTNQPRGTPSIALKMFQFWTRFSWRA